MTGLRMQVNATPSGPTPGGSLTRTRPLSPDLMLSSAAISATFLPNLHIPRGFNGIRHRLSPRSFNRSFSKVCLHLPQLSDRDIDSHPDHALSPPIGPPSIHSHFHVLVFLGDDDFPRCWPYFPFCAWHGVRRVDRYDGPGSQGAQGRADDCVWRGSYGSWDCSGRRAERVEGALHLTWHSQFESIADGSRSCSRM